MDLIEQTYDGFHENGPQGIAFWFKTFQTHYPTVYTDIKNDFAKTGFLLNDATEIRSIRSHISKTQNDNDKHAVSAFSNTNHMSSDEKSSSNWTKENSKKTGKNLNERRIFEFDASQKALTILF